MRYKNINIIYIMETKEQKYVEERKGVIIKLNEILGISEENNKFILEEMIKDKERQEKIIDLEVEVKKYFTYHRWVYFNKRNSIENKWKSLMKSIYKAGGYDLIYKNKTVNNDGVKKMIRECYIIKV
jgi:hypothetical protein